MKDLEQEIECANVVKDAKAPKEGEEMGTVTTACQADAKSPKEGEERANTTITTASQEIENIVDVAHVQSMDNMQTVGDTQLSHMQS